MYTYNHRVDIDSFYEFFKIANFDEVTKERIVELKNQGLGLNQSEYLQINIDGGLPRKYTRVMNRLKMNSKYFNIHSKAEMYLLFMFTIDPNLDAIKILGECNKVNILKDRFTRRFGIYDSNLFKIEKIYVQKFMDKESKKELDEEINRRVYK